MSHILTDIHVHDTAVINKLQWYMLLQFTIFLDRNEI